MGALFAGFEWFAALIGVPAYAALFRYHVGMIPVILACGVVALGYTLVRV